MKSFLSRLSSRTAIRRSQTAKLFGIGVAMTFATPAQEVIAALTLTGTSYIQSFDSIGTGLPVGWSGTTSANSTSLGTTATFATAPIAWSDSAGAFKNFASVGALTSAANTATQAAATDRAFGVRQTSTSSTDPGAAFTLQLNDTIGLTGFTLSLDMNMLSVQPRSTTWTVRYGIGAAPVLFTDVTTYSDPGVFGVTSLTNLDLSGISNSSDNVWIQIVALSASSGGGNRDSFGIDNFQLTYLSGVKSYFDTNGNTAGVGVSGGTPVWDTTTANWNDSVGTGTPAVYSPSTVAIFGGTAGTVSTAVGGVTASGGVQFDSDGYVIQGDSLTLDTNNSVAVTTVGHTATLNSQISGLVGLNKTGAGKLVLGSASSNFTGNVTISAGTLSISQDANLGDAGNGIVLATGTLQATADLSLASTRNVNGNGVLDVESGKTLTINGNVGDMASIPLGIGNTGTVVLAGFGTKSLSSLAFTNSGTLNVTGTDLALGGNLTTTHTSGTATLSGNVSWTAGTRTVTVANGSAATDLLISGNISGGVVLQKFGPGTLALTGNNSALSGSGTTTLASIRLGNAGTTPTEGGVLEFNNADALGTGQLQLNAGTLRNTAGLPLVITNANGISTGAQDHMNSPGGLVFDGADMTFTGPFGLFKASAAISSYQHKITVNNTTTLDGSIVASTGGGNTTGLTVAGTGTLVLNNVTNAADFPITVQDATLELNGGLTTSALTVTPTGKAVTNAFQLGPTAALTVDGLATVRPNGGIAGASKVETLTIGSGGKLNLKDNDLVVGTAADVSDVRTAIKTGVAGAAGITSDLPAFGVSTGFGYALGIDTAISPSLAGSLTGQSYDTDSVLVKYTYLGDADLDGDSDLNDLGLWASAFTGDLGNPAIPSTFWTSGDFDYDGDTDLNDLGLWSSTFTGDLGGGAGSLIVVAPGASAGAISALNGMGITVVPEPSTFMLAGVGLAGLAVASRRKRRA